MKENQHPSNLMAVKPPKLNLEIESCHQFQNNNSIVMSNEKNLYSSQKTITIMSDIANSVLLASNSGPSGEPINHVNIFKACMKGITFERKCKSNLRHIVHINFVALCGPKPDSPAYKAKPRNTRSNYLLGDNLKQVEKDAKRSDEITKKDSYKKNFKV